MKAQSEDATEAQARPEVPDAGTIVVQGTRIRGQLIIDVPPIAEYDAEDIAGFGAGSIADVLEAIAPATGSGSRGGRGGGRPVFLINGIRVSSFREFSNYPPESIAKVEVFAEEVAQRFGFSPDQRVVNIVLKPDFSSLTTEVEYEQPDRGGYSRTEQEATFLKIANGGRLNFNVEVNDTSLLTEAERGLEVDGQPGVAEFRSLIADSFGVEATANYARAFIDSGTSLSLNLAAERNKSRSLSGLDAVTLFAPDGTSAFRIIDADNPLERRLQTDTLSMGGSLNKNFSGWNTTFTADAVRADSMTEIDRRSDTTALVTAAALGTFAIDAALPGFGDPGVDSATSQTTTFVSKATTTGYPITLPAGDVSATFDAGFDYKQLKSEDTRSPLPISVKRRRLAGGANVTVPVLKRDDTWAGFGDVSLTFAGGFENLSDFGTLKDWSAGVNWSPFDSLSLSATRIWREVAPSLTTLGSPRIDLLNTQVFDFTTGQNGFATIISGGNPDLLAETQADWKFSANWRLPFLDGARLQADYGINRSRDVTSSPGFSAAFEEAFPDRVTRGAGGQLTQIDLRPVTLYETRSRVLSFGLNMRGSIGKAPERGERGGRPGGVPPASVAPAGGRPEGAPPGRSGSGFDPARFAEMRKTFCAVPEGEMPDLSAIPEMFRARLMDADGNPDPEKIAAARARFCAADGGEAGPGGEGGPGGDSERFAAMRTAICADPPQLDGLPPQMLERLRGENGEIDPERLKQVRARFCAADDAPQGGSSQAGGGRRGGGGFNPAAMFGRGGDSRARYFLSLNHNITLENEVLLAAGGPLFDQLAGEVLSGGTIPQHSARLEGGIFWQGYGLRLSGRYTGEAELRGAGLNGSNDLFFGDLVTFDVRVFADLGQVLKQEDGWLKGLRVSLLADNVFDARRSVVDSNGVTPDSYEPFRIDPVGRYLGIDIRKAF
ncbi:hypothetical protein [Qipengyuania marisflavi]|uniref:TonB-dependent receptor n=1 Tax=Qipengyuania marisflavi TaxID=2486356 RepID=A0A5S3P6S1_9SPHN|nr:hypothetical protein [Qipengyuania marisflavi]TMM48913.1 TonB-dependent receptor [Qipengyuania marisflavi]